MRKILLFSLFLTGCIVTSSEDESVCVDRCLRFEGTLLHSVTQEPLTGVPVEASFERSSFFLGTKDIKAKATTDVNGFYSLTFEVFDDELDMFGVFVAEIDKDYDEVFQQFANSELLNINNTEVNFDSLYVADEMLPSPASMKVEVGCLGDLEDGAVITSRVDYSFETISGTSSFARVVTFTNQSEEDNVRFSVPADVLLSVNITKESPDGTTTTLEKDIVKLENKENHKVKVRL